MSVRAVSVLAPHHGKGKPFDTLTLTHDQRRIRRKLLQLPKGEEVLVDLADTTTIEHFGGLLLEDGRVVEIVAATEPLYEVTAAGQEQLTKLAWHLGNRHLSAQLEKKRILIPRDHVARAMLTGLGATVREVSEPFSPERGAYHEHGH